MKRILGMILLILMMVLSGCGGAPSSAKNTPPQGSTPSQNPSASTSAPEAVENISGEMKTFSIEPVGGWIFSEAASNDTFKSYNLLEPYVGSANFWVKHISSSTFSGEEKDVRVAAESQGFSDYEFVSADALSYEMPVVRCVMNTTISGMNFTLDHYFIDVPGDKDIYFQLSSAPENFSEAQPLWEAALKTITTK